jgi:hypothetical protein
MSNHYRGGDPRRIEMMRRFIREKPELWSEEIGV